MGRLLAWLNFDSDGDTAGLGREVEQVIQFESASDGARGFSVSNFTGGAPGVVCRKTWFGVANGGDFSVTGFLLPGRG